MPADEVTDHVAHTVRTVASLRSRAQQKVTRQQRAMEVFTAALGRPRTLYVILVFVAGWIALNLVLSHPFDRPPFFWLQGAVGLAAMLTATLILVTQNRQTQEAEQRSQLDLQVNLVAEQKIAKVIDLLEELRRDLPTVRDRVDETADAMTESVNATEVMAALEKTLEMASRDQRPETGVEADPDAPSEADPL